MPNAVPYLLTSQVRLVETVKDCQRELATFPCSHAQKGNSLFRKLPFARNKVLSASPRLRTCYGGSNEVESGQNYYGDLECYKVGCDIYIPVYTSIFRPMSRLYRSYISWADSAQFLLPYRTEHLEILLEMSIRWVYKVVSRSTWGHAVPFDCQLRKFR